jgi:hypothetical protein
MTAPTLPISLFECALPEGVDATEIGNWHAASVEPVGEIAASLQHLLQAARAFAVAIARKLAALLQ